LKFCDRREGGTRKRPMSGRCCSVEKPCRGVANTPLRSWLGQRLCVVAGFSPNGRERRKTQAKAPAPPRISTICEAGRADMPPYFNAYAAAWAPALRSWLGQRLGVVAGFFPIGRERRKTQAKAPAPPRTSTICEAGRADMQPYFKAYAGAWAPCRQTSVKI